MANLIEIRFTEFASGLEILGIITLVFLVLIVAETVWDILSRRRRKYRETLANFAIAIGSSLLGRTFYSLVFLLGLVGTEAFSPFSIPIKWWSWILVFFAVDLTYYWMHRLEHEIRILWAHHVVHHSSPEYNLTTSMRLAWVEELFEWVFFVPMILIGFDAVQTIIVFLFILSYQTWIHTEKIGKLGWLDRVFNTPSVHRVHHGSNSKYLDKNYGGILIIWDRIFGTYQAEEEKVIYGITEPVNSSNPLIINFREYWNIARDVWRSESVSEAFGILFRRPGWAPGYKQKSLEKDYES